MIVGFHSNQLGLRGTETALFDYAHYNEEILGNRSVIFSKKSDPNHDSKAVERFAHRFPVTLYEDRDALDVAVQQHGVEVLYCIKAGFNDQLVSRHCKTVVHAVFGYKEPHGDVYAYVSEWLARHMSGGELPFVPHIVSLPAVTGDLRSELGIPPDAIVFGRHGGADTFDVEFAQQAVARIAEIRPDLYFVFLNTLQFCEPRANIIHLPATSDASRKAAFINSCDAMLHARKSGETFGLAIAEFSISNRPVISWKGSHEQSHYEILGNEGLYYQTPEDLVNILWNFKKEKRELRAYRQFTPEAVMKRFQQVFLS